MASDLAQRTLGAHLRNLRELAGRTTRQLAAELGMSQSSITRIEHGRLGTLTWAQVRAWANACNATTEQFDMLASVADSALAEAQPWRELLEDQPQLQDQIREQEASARLLLIFQPTIVPGLLQTAEYARQVIELADTTNGVDRNAALAKRLGRQDALYNQRHRFEFLITEAALRWRSNGPTSVLAMQLDRIVSLANLPNVTVGVIPTDAEMLALVWAGFVIYDERDDAETFVTIELSHEYLTVRKPHDVAIYREQWERLYEAALFGPDALAFIQRLAAELSRGDD